MEGQCALFLIVGFIVDRQHLLVDDGHIEKREKLNVGEHAVQTGAQHLLPFLALGLDVEQVATILEEIIQPGRGEETGRILAEPPILFQVANDLGVAHIGERVSVGPHVTKPLVAIRLKALLSSFLIDDSPHIAERLSQFPAIVAVRHVAWLFLSRRETKVLGHDIGISNPVATHQPLVGYLRKLGIVAVAIKKIKLCHSCCVFSVGKRTPGVRQSHVPRAAHYQTTNIHKQTKTQKESPQKRCIFLSKKERKRPSNEGFYTALTTLWEF